ncbi:MAG: FHA domain-containing protein [Chloroflexota bacterium]
MTIFPTSDTDWAIEFRIENFEDPVRLKVDQQLYLGRNDTNQMVFEGFDLSAYDAEEKGVSRKHAAVRWQGPQLYLYDMGSANGTVLNDIRLQPNVGYHLSEGDVLHLGYLGMTVHLNTDLGQSSIAAQRVEFNLRNVPMRGHGQRVLIVEDDAGITQLYKIALEGGGFSVQITRDVVGAMRALGQATPALIILDLMLPSVHGLELCRYIRRDTDGPVIPIVVVSASVDPSMVKSSMDNGVDVFMTKPVNIKELVRVVAAVIHKNESENPSMQTKQLRGTASLDDIAAAPREDTIVIFVDDQREPIGAVVQPQLTLGRHVSGSQSRSHVDLDSYGAFDRGVSRIHARIKRDGKKFLVEDLDSSNGTFINAKPLEPNTPYPLKSGNELRLGELRMRVYLLGDTGLMKRDVEQAEAD